MLPLLQWYILREMGKTFLLTAVGLTVVLGLGGGVMNLMDQEQITPSQFFRLMVIVLPVAGSLTLPVAALYSASVTYGRLSADNELLACRSSGINIHRLFLPTLMLSLLVSVCTFYFTNFLIPGLVRNLQDLARVNLRQLVVQQLDSPKRLGFRGLPVKFYADHATALDDLGAIALDGVAFLKVESPGPPTPGAGEDGRGDESFTRYGTAESILIQFSQSAQGDTVVSGKFINATVFDRQGVADVAEQTFGPEVVTQQIGAKVKWLDLSELLHYRRRPQDWPKVGDALAHARAATVRSASLAQLYERLVAGGEIALGDARAQLTLRAGSVAWTPAGDKLLLQNVTCRERRDGRVRDITGDRGELIVTWDDGSGVLSANVQVEGNAAVATPGGPPQHTGRVRLTDLAFDEPAVQSIEAIDDAQWLDPGATLPFDPAAADKRAEAIRQTKKFLHSVTSELHSRLAFSASVFALVILGAALGVVFRGSHVLVAFGISFVPALFVIVMNIMGRHLAEKEGTLLLGLGTIWGSIAVVALLDVWALARGVRR